MSVQTWGSLPKAQDNAQTVDEQIDAKIADHEADPSAHLGDDESLTSHRASEIIDHVAKSIVNDKIIEVARAYTAILKVPTTQASNYFFPAVQYEEDPLVVVSPSKTIPEILGRLTPDDSEYIYMPMVPSYGTYFQMQNPDLPVGTKAVKIKLHIRAKILNPTVSTLDFGFMYNGGYDEADFQATSSWQDFTKEIFEMVDGDDVFGVINQDRLDAYTFDVFVMPEGSDTTKNQLAISSFYIEVFVPVDAEREDFFDLKDAVDYVNSLGGGSVFIKNGAYDMGRRKTALNSYVELYGESLAGVVFSAPDYDYNFLIGTDIAPLYTAGTITLTQNSASVTASGVSWTSANTVGKYLLDKRTGHYYPIISWQDSTHVTLGEIFQGVTASSLAYEIVDMTCENKVSNMTFFGEFTISKAINITLQNVLMQNGSLRLDHLENLQMLDCELSAVSTNVKFDYISQSTFRNCAFRNHTGMILWFKANSIGNIIEDCLFIDNKNQCVLFEGSENILKGSYFRNNGWTGGQLYPPILTYSTSHHNAIVNNIIRYCNSYGIGSQSGADYNLVIGNICTDNYSAGVVNNGAHSVTASNVV
jgi:hypothetical protein